MKEYLEQQLKKKAHELIVAAYKVAAKVKGQKGAVFSLRQNVSKIPVAIFEAQDRQFDEDKIKYFSGARNSLFEARYYLDFLYNAHAVSYYSYRQVAAKMELLDKILVSRVTSIDKRKAHEQYKVVIREKFIQ